MKSHGILNHYCSRCAPTPRAHQQLNEKAPSTIDSPLVSTTIISLTGFDRLPPEIFPLILQCLDTKTLLNGPLLVCKRWRTFILSTNSLWQHVSFGQLSNYSKLYQRLEAHKKLSCDSIKSIQISLGLNSNFDDYVLGHSFRHLESLKLSINMTRVYPFLKSHPQLVELDLSFVTSPLSVQGILLTLPRLEYLRLRSTLRSKNNPILLSSKEIIIHPIKVLKISDSELMMDTVKTILFNNLESLYIYYPLPDFLANYQPPEFQTNRTIAFPKLRRLVVGFWLHQKLDNINRVDLPALEELHSISSTVDLSKLSFPSLKRLQADSNVEDYPKLTPYLQNLQVNGDFLHNAGMVHVILEWPDLAVLKIRSEKITNQLLIKLEEVLPPRLHTLELVTTQGWSDYRQAFSGPMIVQLVQNRIKAETLSNGAVSRIKSLTVDLINDDHPKSVEWLKINVPDFVYNTYHHPSKLM